MSTPRPIRVETFHGHMREVILWHLLLTDAEAFPARTGKGLAGLWAEIRRGTFVAARAHMDRLLAEENNDEIPDAPTVKVTPDGRGRHTVEVRCPFCRGTHFHSPGPWGPNGDKRVADCGFRGYRITDPDGLFEQAVR